MRKFKVTVEGKNIAIRLEGRITWMGFFATRFIESNTQEAAKQTALTLIEAELRDIILNRRARPPVFVVEDVVEVEAFDAGSSGAGFTWYPDDEEEDSVKSK